MQWALWTYVNKHEHSLSGWEPCLPSGGGRRLHLPPSTVFARLTVHGGVSILERLSRPVGRDYSTKIIIKFNKNYY